MTDAMSPAPAARKAGCGPFRARPGAREAIEDHTLVSLHAGISVTGAQWADHMPGAREIVDQLRAGPRTILELAQAAQIPRAAVKALVTDLLRAQMVAHHSCQTPSLERLTDACRGL